MRQKRLAAHPLLRALPFWHQSAHIPAAITPTGPRTVKSPPTCFLIRINAPPENLRLVSTAPIQEGAGTPELQSQQSYLSVTSTRHRQRLPARCLPCRHTSTKVGAGDTAPDPASLPARQGGCCGSGMEVSRYRPEVLVCPSCRENHATAENPHKFRILP